MCVLFKIKDEFRTNMQWFCQDTRDHAYRSVLVSLLQDFPMKSRNQLQKSGKIDLSLAIVFPEIHVKRASGGEHTIQ